MSYAKVLSSVLALLVAFAGVTFTDGDAAQAASISRPAAEVGVSTSTWTDVCLGSCDLSGFSSTVKVVVWVANGYVRLQSTTGFGSALTGYPSTKWLDGTAAEIAFTASQSDANNALEGLQYLADGSGTYELRITVTEFVAGTAVDPNTGHFYEVVNVGSTIRWEDARCIAKWGNSSRFTGSELWNNETRSTLSNDGCSPVTSRRQLFGQNGYLANITSEAEQTFLKDKIDNVGWIGGSDHTTDGLWQWNDGPEAGQVFFVQYLPMAGYLTTSTRRTTNSLDGRSMFNYFSDGEPNGAGGSESFAEFGYGANGAIGKSWNDCANSCNRTAYIIEYGGDGGDGSASNASTTSFSVVVPAAPQVTASTAPTGTDVSGNVVRGVVLTSAVTFSGFPAPIKTYVWQQTPSLSGSPVWTAISGQTQATLTVSSGQVGRYLRSVVTATNVEGSVIGTSSPSQLVEIGVLTAPDLNSASDTGSNTSDDLTYDSTPTIDLVDATEGATATVTAAQASSADVTCTTPIADSSGLASCTLGELGLGAWSVTATQSLNGLTSSVSAALTITIESPPPVTAPSTPAVIPTPTATPTPSPTASNRPANNPTRPRPAVTPGTIPIPTPLSKPVLLNPPTGGGTAATVGGEPITPESRPRGKQELEVIVGTVDLKFTVPNGSGGIQESGGKPKLEVKRDQEVDLAGGGMLPGSTVQIWLPGTSGTAEFGRIPVGDDGEFAGQIGFTSDTSSKTIRIGEQSIQLTGLDGNGNQTVISMTINIAQPNLAPELLRGETNTPKPGFGNFVASNAGQDEDATLTGLEDLRQALIEGQNWQMGLTLAGEDSELTGDGGSVSVTLIKGESVGFEGNGFMPGTIASIWLFSEPRMLGEVSIGPNGSFDGSSIPIPEDLEAGEHTVQIQAVGSDGFIRSANLGVEVKDPLSEAAWLMAILGWLPFVLVGIVSLGVIFAIVISRRRRNTLGSNVIPFRRAA